MATAGCSYFENNYNRYGLDICMTSKRTGAVYGWSNTLWFSYKWTCGVDKVTYENQTRTAIFYQYEDKQNCASSATSTNEWVIDDPDEGMVCDNSTTEYTNSCVMNLREYISPVVNVSSSNSNETCDISDNDYSYFQYAYLYEYCYNIDTTYNNITYASMYLQCDIATYDVAENETYPATGRILLYQTQGACNETGDWTNYDLSLNADECYYDESGKNYIYYELITCYGNGSDYKSNSDSGDNGSAGVRVNVFAFYVVHVLLVCLFAVFY